jgi:drug/metabolite transporter superfamily protein YnfA
LNLLTISHIVMAPAWRYVVDGIRPTADLIGAAVCLVGVLITFFGPRGSPT